MSNVWERQVIPGLYLVGINPLEDDRGAFHKILADLPPETGPLNFDEIYWSSSRSGVARGMHFQVPPHEGRKLVFATSGSVLDLVIDLRVGSPTFHHVWEMHLSPKSQGVLIPAGCAHGFVVIDFPAVLVYAQECAYDRDCDTGVNIASLTFSRGVEGLQLSDRDRALLDVVDFDSPFVFDSAAFVGWRKWT